MIGGGGGEDEGEEERRVLPLTGTIRSNDSEINGLRVEREEVHAYVCSCSTWITPDDGCHYDQIIQ